MEVRVIGRKGQALLVEWLADGGLRRAVVPADALHDGGVDADTLERGIAYGVPWEELIVLGVTPGLIASELRRRGIWTQADLHDRPMVALAALQAAYAVDLGALRAAAQRYDKEM